MRQPLDLPLRRDRALCPRREGGVRVARNQRQVLPLRISEWQDPAPAPFLDLGGCGGTPFQALSPPLERPIPTDPETGFGDRARADHVRPDTRPVEKGQLGSRVADLITIEE